MEAEEGGRGGRERREAEEGGRGGRQRRERGAEGGVERGSEEPEASLNS